MPQISLSDFIDIVRIARQWGMRTDDMVFVEMAYTFGYAQARKVVGGYVDGADSTAVIMECGTLEKIVRNAQ